MTWHNNVLLHIPDLLEQAEAAQIRITLTLCCADHIYRGL